MARAKTPEIPMIQPRTATQKVESFSIEVPMAEPPEGTYIAGQHGRIEVQLSRVDELPGFRRLHAGLRGANVVMKSGKPVESAADVIRWMMQQLTSGAA
jgi:hypothetical protein